MSLLMNMKMDGVSGESSSYQFKGWSEIHSWSWGMTSNRKLTVKADGDKTSFNELSVIKPVGIDSPAIRRLFAQGETIASVVLSIVPVVSKKEAQTRYVNLLLENVMIKSIVTGGGVDENFFKEHITLLFDKVRFECSRNIPPTMKTEAVAVDDEFSWDVSANTGWQKAEG